MCSRFALMPLIESKHLALNLSLNIISNFATSAKSMIQSFRVEKYIWDDDRYEEFYGKMNSDYVKKKLEEAMKTIDVDINTSLSIVSECFKYAGDSMQKTLVFGNNKRKTWFDNECRENRTALRKAL